MEFFVLLIGHLFGDYAFQNQWLAINKSKFNLKGWLACFIHCVIYTFVIWLTFLVFDLHFSFTFYILIFLSHFIPDKLSILTSNYTQYLRNLKHSIDNVEDIIRLNICIIVYVVIDNAIHLFLMALILKYYL